MKVEIPGFGNRFRIVVNQPLVDVHGTLGGGVQLESLFAHVPSAREGQVCDYGTDPASKCDGSYDDESRCDQCGRPPLNCGAVFTDWFGQPATCNRPYAHVGSHYRTGPGT